MEIGYYIRINRDGRWQPVDICELTDAEFDEFFERQEKDALVNWLRCVLTWIKDNVKEEQIQ